MKEIKRGNESVVYRVRKCKREWERTIVEAKPHYLTNLDGCRLRMKKFRMEMSYFGVNKNSCLILDVGVSCCRFVENEEVVLDLFIFVRIALRIYLINAAKRARRSASIVICIAIKGSI